MILLTIIHHLGHQHHLCHLERELVWLSGCVRPGHFHLHQVYPWEQSTDYNHLQIVTALKVKGNVEQLIMSNLSKPT